MERKEVLKSMRSARDKALKEYFTGNGVSKRTLIFVIRWAIASVFATILVQIFCFGLLVSMYCWAVGSDAELLKLRNLVVVTPPQILLKQIAAFANSLLLQNTFFGLIFGFLIALFTIIRPAMNLAKQRAALN